MCFVFSIFLLIMWNYELWWRFYLSFLNLSLSLYNCILGGYEALHVWEGEGILFCVFFSSSTPFDLYWDKWFVYHLQHLLLYGDAISFVEFARRKHMACKQSCWETIQISKILFRFKKDIVLFLGYHL